MTMFPAGIDSNEIGHAAKVMLGGRGRFDQHRHAEPRDCDDLCYLFHEISSLLRDMALMVARIAVRMATTHFGLDWSTIALVSAAGG